MAIATTSVNDAKHRIRRIRTGKYMVYTGPRYRHRLYKLRTRENQYREPGGLPIHIYIRYQHALRVLRIEQFENRPSNRMIRRKLAGYVTFASSAVSNFGLSCHSIVAIYLLTLLPTGTNMIEKTSMALALWVGTILALSSAFSQDADSVRLIASIQGPQLYGAYCAVCHGKEGKGAGPMAKSLKPVTPDLTQIAARNGGKFPLTRVQQIISGEVPASKGHGTRDMPVWGPIFSQVAWDQDLGRIRVYNLAKFIETWQVKK